MAVIFSLCILILTGTDCKISYLRWKKFGINIELNPIVRSVGRDNGLMGALAALIITNLALLALCSHYPTLLHILFGAKIALAALQIKSLEY